MRPTVFAARQFVNHGHVKVNGQRVTIASYRVKVGDVVEAFLLDFAGHPRRAILRAELRHLGAKGRRIR